MSEQQFRREEMRRERIREDLTWLWENGGYTAEDLWANLLKNLLSDFRDTEESEKKAAE